MNEMIDSIMKIFAKPFSTITKRLKLSLFTLRDHFIYARPIPKCFVHRL